MLITTNFGGDVETRRNDDMLRACQFFYENNNCREKRQRHQTRSHEIQWKTPGVYVKRDETKLTVEPSKKAGVLVIWHLAVCKTYTTPRLMLIDTNGTRIHLQAPWLVYQPSIRHSSVCRGPTVSHAH